MLPVFAQASLHCLSFWTKTSGCFVSMLTILASKETVSKEVHPCDSKSSSVSFPGGGGKLNVYQMFETYPCINGPCVLQKDFLRSIKNNKIGQECQGQKKHTHPTQIYVLTSMYIKLNINPSRNTSIT